MTGPYGSAALDYLETGWGVPLPLPKGQKAEPPKRTTGRDVPDATRDEVTAWAGSRSGGNIAMRLAPGVVAIDVDAYKGAKELRAWQDLQERLGPLPAGPCCTSRQDHDSGAYLFRVPDDYEPRGDLPGKPKPGEVIWHGYRYVVVPPSVHPQPRPDGGRNAYRWRDGRDAPPGLDDLPWLPGPWLAALAAGTTPDGRRETGWTDPDLDRLVTRGVAPGDSQHDVLRDVMFDLARRGETKAAARLIWRAIVSHTEETRPGEPWTDADFALHWETAVAKLGEQAPPPLAPADGPDERGRRIVLTRASEIEPAPVVWAWEDDGAGRIPAGSLGLAAGREGTGKSSCMVWAAAQITTGTLPGAFYGQPRAVIVVAVEDSWKYTIVSRLIAAGADLALVYRAEVQVVEGETVMLSLPADNKLLEQAIGELGAALVVIDPLLSAVSDALDTHVNRQVRQALDPLSAIADRTGAVIAGVAHFNKSGGSDASSLITASGAFKDVARFILAFATEPESDGSGVITQTKNSLGRSGLPSLAYRIISAIVPTPTGDADVGRFVLDGPSERSVGDILSDPAGDGRNEKTRAEEYLRKALADGPRRTKDVEDEAKNGHGVSKRTLERARGALLIPSRKRQSGPADKDGTRAWEWWVSLPEHEGDLREPWRPPTDGG